MVAGFPSVEQSPNKQLKPKRTVQKLTNGDRKWICQRRLEQPDEKFADMQQAFKDARNDQIELKSGTVSGILKQSDKWLSIADGQETGTRTRSSKEPELEAALFAWRSEQLAKDEKVRDEDLRAKARELAAAMGINTDKTHKGLSFSSGWLDRFKKRNRIQQTTYRRKDTNRGVEEMKAPFYPQLGHGPDGLDPDRLHPELHHMGVATPLAHPSSALQHAGMPFDGAIPPVPRSASVPQSVALNHSFALAQQAHTIPLPGSAAPSPASVPRPYNVPEMFPNEVTAERAEAHRLSNAEPAIPAPSPEEVSPIMGQPVADLHDCNLQPPMRGSMVMQPSGLQAGVHQGHQALPNHYMLQDPQGDGMHRGCLPAMPHSGIMAEHAIPAANTQSGGTCGSHAGDLPHDMYPPPSAALEIKPHMEGQ